MRKPSAVVGQTRVRGALQSRLAQMALNETKRQLLTKILDHVRDTGEFPERRRFEANINPAHWEALGELVTDRFLFEEQYDCMRLVPTFRGLGQVREHHVFAASEIGRAVAILPLLQDEYRDGLHEKECSVTELAAKEKVQCTPNEMRRTVRTMRVLGMIGGMNPNNPAAVESFTLTRNVLLLKPEDLDPPDPDADQPPTDDSVPELALILQDAPAEPPPSGALAAAWAAQEERRARVEAYDSRRFHQAVVQFSREVFLLGGHQREALDRATRASLDEVKKRSGRNDLDGEDLVIAAFNEKNPTLELPDRSSLSGQSEQRGVFYLARAVVSLLRNPNAHELRSHTDEEALEGLGLVSLLHRYLDRMTLAPVQAPASASAPAGRAVRARGKPEDSVATEPIIEIELCDPTTRTRLGRTASLVSVVLDDAPAFTLDDDTLKGIVGSIDIVKRQIEAFRPRDIFAPSPEDLAKHKRALAILRPIGFYVHHRAGPLVEDMRIRLEIPKVSGLQVLDELPEKPSGPGGMIIPRFSGNASRVTHVRSLADTWEVDARITKVQPKATEWSAPFFVGCESEIDLDLVAEVFADNMTGAPDVPVKVAITVEHRCLTDGTDQEEAGST